MHCCGHTAACFFHPHLRRGDAAAAALSPWVTPLEGGSEWGGSVRPRAPLSRLEAPGPGRSHLPAAAANESLVW